MQCNLCGGRIYVQRVYTAGRNVYRYRKCGDCKAVYVTTETETDINEWYDAVAEINRELYSNKVN